MIEKELLYELYINQDKSSCTIAKELGIGETTVLRYIKKYKIPIKSRKGSLPITPDKFRELYINQNKTRQDIASIFNVSLNVINRFVSKYKIYKPQGLQSITTSKLAQERKKQGYTSPLKGISRSEEFCKKISNSLKNSQKVQERFKQEKENFRPQISREALYEAFIIQNNTIKDCAKIFNLSRDTIRRYCMRYNIKKSEEQQAQIRSAKAKKSYIENKDNLHTIRKENSKALINWKEENLELYYAMIKQNGYNSIERLQEWCESHPNEYKESRKISGEKLLEWLKEHPEEIKNNIEKTKETCLKKYGVSSTLLLNAETKISKLNKKWAEYLQLTEFEKIVGFYSYDLALGKILLEVNPCVTHSDIACKAFNLPFKSRTAKYHINKSMNAHNNGYHCIHIWDWDDKEKVKNLLKEKIKIYARNTVIQKIPEREASVFNNLYHLQNTCKGQEICLGLYYEEKLVSLMSFGKPRYNKNYQYELLRYTTHPDYMILGGAEKLFRHFIQMYNPDSIISYCDYSKFSGQVYDKLGFKRKCKIKPSKHWYNPKTMKHFTQNLVNQLGVDKLLGTKYGKGTDNQQLLLSHGFFDVWDCGQLVFEYHNKL